MRSLAIVAALVLAAGACSSDGDGGSAPDPGADSTGTVEVAITPERSGLADPLAITVTGPEPEAKISLEVTSTDSEGVAWESSTAYRADDTGAIDLDARAGVSDDLDPMAPISSMRPVDPDAETVGYFWSGELQAFKVTVLVDDEEVASAEVQRGAPVGVPAATTTVADDGLVGQLWMPPDGVEVRTPAIVNLGGSEGGLRGHSRAAPLAAEGYPVLDVAYFNGDFLDAPGLPAELADIPLEYFTGAIEWLDDQPEVDPDRIWVMGASRGSEAALLLGTQFPDLVSGVVALAPSNVVLCRPDCDGPAWTLDGDPVPFTSQLLEPAPHRRSQGGHPRGADRRTRPRRLRRPGRDLGRMCLLRSPRRPSRRR